MEMVAQNRLAQEINPKVPSLMNRLLVDPGFSMIKILAAERIIPQEKAAANRAVHHMHNGNLIRCKHPQHEPTEPCVTSSPTANRLKQTAEVYKTKSACHTKCCVPRVFASQSVCASLRSCPAMSGSSMNQQNQDIPGNPETRQDRF